MSELHAIAQYLDALLDTGAIPDYPGAHNGIQLANRGSIRRIAAAVDVSIQVIRRTVEVEANLLVVHHGMFWGGVQPLTGAAYERLQLLISHDIAVYSSHLPLDAHPTFGNNTRLAQTLGLHPTAGFARFKTVEIGLRGESDVPTHELWSRADAFARAHGGIARCTTILPDRQTRSWGICTGAGASTETLLEARDVGLDTLIVGEGPHHTAVMAEDLGIAVIYAGHYATETLGVQALSSHVTERFGIPSTFIPAPTGL